MFTVSFLYLGFAATKLSLLFIETCRKLRATRCKPWSESQLNKAKENLKQICNNHNFCDPKPSIERMYDEIACAEQNKDVVQPWRSIISLWKQVDNGNNVWATVCEVSLPRVLSVSLDRPENPTLKRVYEPSQPRASQAISDQQGQNCHSCGRTLEPRAILHEAGQEKGARVNENASSRPPRTMLYIFLGTKIMRRRDCSPHLNIEHIQHYLGFDKLIHRTNLEKCRESTRCTWPLKNSSGDPTSSWTLSGLFGPFLHPLLVPTKETRQRGQQWGWGMARRRTRRRTRRGTRQGARRGRWQGTLWRERSGGRNEEEESPEQEEKSTRRRSSRKTGERKPSLKRAKKWNEEIDQTPLKTTCSCPSYTRARFPQQMWPCRTTKS